MTTSGRSRSSISIASAPDAAASTCSPRPSSAFSTTFRTLRLSSTTRTFGIGRLLGVRRRGRARPALVDLDRGAEQELLEVAVNRLRPVGGVVLELAEDEAAVRFAVQRPVRRHQERGECRLADEPEELSVHHLTVVEDDDASAGGECDEQLAGLAPERDGLRDVREVHDSE